MRSKQLLLAAILTAGCDSSTELPIDEPLREVRIEAVTPTDLGGTVATEVTPVPTVRATDQDGRPVPGVPISFYIRDGGGAIANDSINTDSLGLATVGNWMLGRKVEPQTLVVRSSGHTSVVFRARVTAGPVVHIYRDHGYGQVAAVRETLLQPLRVAVTDAFNNPVVGVTVTFTVISGDGRVEGSTALTTEFGFAASGPWTLGSLPGVQQVSARSAGTEVAFSAFACKSCDPFLLFVRGRHIYRTNGDGRKEIVLTEGSQPAWSPDGQRIVFARSSGGRSDIYLMDANGSNIVRRTFSGGGSFSSPGFHSPAWSPDGRTLAVAAGGVHDTGIYILSVAADGKEPVLIRDGAAQPAWSPDGSKIAFVRLGWYQSLDVMNADGSDVRTVTPIDVHAPATFDHPTWSPDGRRIVFSQWDLINDVNNVYSVGSDGSGLTLLTGGWVTGNTAWSPDGAWIAFTIWTTERYETEVSIAFVPADTGGEPFTIIAFGSNPAWQPGPQRNWR